MIDKNTVLEQIGGKCALWCGADMDAGELAQAVGVIGERNIRMVSVAQDSVATIWPWVERDNIKIMSRFYFADKKISEKQISDVTVRINNAFKHGAGGAQIFLPYAALADLVEQTYVIRDDLFFDKDLSIGVDVAEFGPYDWSDLFGQLRRLNATSVVFVFTKDAGDKSDFVGRIYGMLNAWDADNKFDLHFAFGPNFMRIEQALRLVQSVRPELVGRLKFWVNY